LLIRRFEPDDAAFILELVNTASWLKYIGNRNVHSEEEALHYLENHTFRLYRDFGFGSYLVATQDTGHSIGTCGLIKRPELEDVDLGFAFLPEYERQGYGYESARAVMDHAWQDLGISRLVAITLPENEASIKLLIKLGMQFEKEMIFGKENELINLYSIMLPNRKH